MVDLRDPFYASTSPQMYAIAAATVVSYMLVIMLFITPRTFFVGGAGGGSGFLGRRGIISGASGSTSVIGVGGRPWLQKVATLTVAISLTIATADTFRVAEKQYEAGYQDATALTDEVVDGLEIRTVRVISTTFLWLAQVQTLIRLFPRHKEKVVIKWTGFGLIVLDTIFAILNNFVNKTGKTRPRTFVDAIPALSYLFELSLSLLYAAWVIYYSLEKRRFAFFHPKMRNICMVALLSLAAVLIPVVFFVLDISKPDVSGWGEYMRWVGAAAASVVVWEWVERIEALERDERRDGILGREIFDGDEMLEVTPSSEVSWPGNHQMRRKPDEDGGKGHTTSARLSGVEGVANRMTRARLPPRYSRQARYPTRSNRPLGHEIIMTDAVEKPHSLRDNGSSPPPTVASPVSRTDTTSAASTVYAVHYHPISESTSPNLHRPLTPDGNNVERGAQQLQQHQLHEQEMLAPPVTTKSTTSSSSNQAPSKSRGETTNRMRTILNPFKRRRISPPLEISHASEHVVDRPQHVESGRSQSDSSPNRRSALERLKARTKSKATEDPLPMMIIPAQPRGRVWSPETVEGNAIERLPSAEDSSAPSAVVNHAVESSMVGGTEDFVNGLGDPQTTSTNSRQGQDLSSPGYTNGTDLSQRGTLVISEGHPRGTIDSNIPPGTARSQPMPLNSLFAPSNQLELSQDANATLDPVQIHTPTQTFPGMSAGDANPQPRRPP